MSSEDNCIFCKIIKGEAPSKKVYENEFVFALFPLEQISRGHTIIIPKKHYADIFDIPENELKEIIVAAKKIAKAMENGLGAAGINIMHASRKEAQQSVFHFHIHLVPRYKDDGIDTWPKIEYRDKNLYETCNKVAKEIRGEK